MLNFNEINSTALPNSDYIFTNDDFMHCEEFKTKKKQFTY